MVIIAGRFGNTTYKFFRRIQYYLFTKLPEVLRWLDKPPMNLISLIAITTMPR